MRKVFINAKKSEAFLSSMGCSRISEFEGMEIPDGVGFYRFVNDDMLNETTECQSVVNEDIDDDPWEGISTQCRNKKGHVECSRCVFSKENNNARLKYFRSLNRKKRNG